MEIDVTSLVGDQENWMEYSGSRMEHGQDVGRITWERSCERAEDGPLLSTEEQFEAARKYFRSFGAWDEDEIAAWTPQELNALFIQFVAGNLREYPLTEDGEIDWMEAEELGREGNIAGGIYRGDDGKFWFYLGN